MLFKILRTSGGEFSCTSALQVNADLLDSEGELKQFVNGFILSPFDLCGRGWK